VTTLSANDVPRLPRGVRVRYDAVRNSHVLLAPERAFDLDETAAAILELVDGHRSVATIVDELAAKFQADRAMIEGDVIEMLTELATKRILDR
jgi:pyrroloquinoline quinone biosynthesis protein D